MHEDTFPMQKNITIYKWRESFHVEKIKVKPNKNASSSFLRGQLSPPFVGKILQSKLPKSNWEKERYRNKLFNPEATQKMHKILRKFCLNF